MKAGWLPALGCLLGIATVIPDSHTCPDNTTPLLLFGAWTWPGPSLPSCCLRTLAGRARQAGPGRALVLGPFYSPAVYLPCPYRLALHLAPEGSEGSWSIVNVELSPPCKRLPYSGTVGRPRDDPENKGAWHWGPKCGGLWPRLLASRVFQLQCGPPRRVTGVPVTNNKGSPWD